MKSITKTDTKTIFIHFPPSFEDVILTIPAIKNLTYHFADCKLIISIEKQTKVLFEGLNNIIQIIEYDQSLRNLSFFALYSYAKQVQRVDFAISFEKYLKANWMLSFVDKLQKFTFDPTKYTKHKAKEYNNFINNSFDTHYKVDNLSLFKEYKQTEQNQTPIAGINLIDLKQNNCMFESDNIIQLVLALYKTYDIKIFINNSKLQDELKEKFTNISVHNYKFIDDKEFDPFVNHLANLDLFISSVSYPFYIANCFNIETLSVFFDSNYKQLRHINNPAEIITVVDQAKCADDIINKYEAEILSESIPKKKLKKEFLYKFNLPKTTKIILFKANNFIQNGIFDFLQIVQKISIDNYQVVICGDDKNLDIAKKSAQELELVDKILFVNNFALKACDIFILPTKNKTFSLPIYSAMLNKCVVFAPRTNAIAQILDTFALMYAPNDPNTAYKINAILHSDEEIKKIQKQNRKKALEF